MKVDQDIIRAVKTYCETSSPGRALVLFIEHLNGELPDSQQLDIGDMHAAQFELIVQTLMDKWEECS